MCNAMLLASLLAAQVIAQNVPAEQPPRPASAPATSQPAQEPPRTARRPVQAEILEALLRDREAQKPIQPVDPSAPAGQGAVAPEQANLLLEGSILVDRAGRLVRTHERAEFEFVGQAGDQALPPMIILESQYLEALEREADAGAREFVITAEVTRYRGRNYLRILKLTRRLENGNLSP
jgi:hypothetical protein